MFGERSESNVFESKPSKPFKTEVESSKMEEKPAKPLNLFDDDDDDLFNEDLFSSISKKKFSSGLFENDAENDFLQPNTTGLFIDEGSEELFAVKNFEDAPPPSESVKKEIVNKIDSLFDDFDEKTDLFSATTERDLQETKGDERKISGKPETGATSYRIDLFDPSPPPLDEWEDRTSENFEETPYDSNSSAPAHLFNNELPLLPNESSGIVRDQSAR